MKTPNYILLVICFLTVNLAQAQEEEKESKFNVIAYGGIGYGIIENDKEPNYNLNSNSGEILLNYKLGQNIGIATGIGMNELSGNGFNAVGNFYHERTLLKVPLLFTSGSNLSENFSVLMNFGFYGQNIVKDAYHFLDKTHKGVYDGWNFGVQTGIGFVFELFENFSAGINYNAQSDFSKFESNDNGGIIDKQKMKNLSSVGIMLLVAL
jgi:opacity protein-like surface antigen